MSTETRDDPGLEALERSHLELSHADWALREHALAHPEYQRRASFPRFAEPPEFVAFKLQPWPTLVRRSKLEELARLSVGVSELIRSLPERVFGGDAEAIARYYGLPSAAVVRSWLSEPRGIAQAVARGDFMITRKGFQCIEVNFWAALGGWETALLAGWHLETPLTARFFAERGLEPSWVDTLDLMLEHVLAEAEALAPDRDRPLNIAFGFSHGEPPALVAACEAVLHAAYAKKCEQLGRSRDSAALACFPEQLTPRSDGGLRLGERPIHAVVALYLTNPVHVFRSFKMGKIALLNPPICQLLSDKRSLAMLSMLAETELVSAEERRLIEQVIPWTRSHDVPKPLAGVCPPVSAQELIARREQLVLKSAVGSGGRGVHLGRFTPPAEWSALVEQALAGPRWVVQEYLETLPFLYQDGEQGCSAHDVNWGPFVLGRKPGGLILRMQSQSAGGPINLSLSATEGMVFAVEG